MNNPISEDKTYRLQDDGSLAWLFFHTVRKLQKSGKSGYSQQRILNILDDCGPVSQKKMQEMLSVQPGSLSELCGKLEEKGMIQRTRDENDRRNVILTITEEGRRMKKEIPAHKDEKIFSSLSEKEMTQLRTILTRLSEQFEKQETAEESRKEIG